MTLKEKFCLSQSRILIAETKIYRNNSIGMELNGTMVNGDLVYAADDTTKWLLHVL